MNAFKIDNLRTPFIESPFYKKLRENYSEHEYIEFADMLNDCGYCIVDTDLSEPVINQANLEISNLIENGNFKKNSEAYHYNDSPRIVEGWKTCKSIKEIAVSKKINEILSFCYQSKAIPFSTINFLKGTEQPLHSDEFHFGSIPHKYLAGCWIALEDIDPDSGPLAVAVGSQRLPIFSFEMLGLPVPKSEKEIKNFYTIYEDWVREMILANNIKVVTPKLKKGQCLIWSSNVLHGSYEIKNKNLSRRSLVVHFHFEACEKIFYPSHSNLEQGKFVQRSLENLDIRKQ